MLNADSWNYYWSQASGVTQTTDLFPAGNRDALMSFSDYLTARAGAGLGLGAVRRPTNYIRKTSLYGGAA